MKTLFALILLAGTTAYADGPQYLGPCAESAVQCVLNQGLAVTKVEGAHLASENGLHYVVDILHGEGTPEAISVTFTDLNCDGARVTDIVPPLQR